MWKPLRAHRVAVATQAFMPAFRGALDTTGDGKLDMLEIEDITHGFDKATTSVMDIKLGTRTYIESVSTKHNDKYVKQLKGFGVHRERCRSVAPCCSAAARPPRRGPSPCRPAAWL